MVHSRVDREDLRLSGSYVIISMRSVWKGMKSMRRYACVGLIVALVLAALLHMGAPPASAQEEAAPLVYLRYDVEITLMPDGSFHVRAVRGGW